MNTPPNCPKCNSEYSYDDGQLFVCPDCQFEWDKNGSSEPETEQTTENLFKDAYGNILNDGDSITIIKDLKLKGSSIVVKVGTKVKNIHLVDGDHNIDCKVPGIGPMKLKSEFVKKV